jgi:hypothetical protein
VQRVEEEFMMYSDAMESSEARSIPWSRTRRWAYGLGAAFTIVVLVLFISVPSLLRSRQSAETRSFVQGPAAEPTPPQALNPPGFAPVPFPQAVIRTINLTMITNEFDAARSKIDMIVRQSQGYIDRLNVRAGIGPARGLSATVRVPANRADAALNDLKSLGHLMQESQNSSDITSQYVDLTARLSNARNSEQRLLALLRDRTGDLKDVIAMEREISTVRENIERMEAQRKDFDNKVQFVTIQVELNEEYHAELAPPTPSTRTQLRNAAVDGIQNGAENTVDIALFILRYGPSLLIWFAVLGPLFVLILRLRGIELRRRL